MRIHVVYNAYNEVDLVERSLKTVYPHVDSIAIADVMHSDGKTVSNDGTHEKIMKFIDDNKGGRAKLFYRDPKPLGSDYKTNQGSIKTELMNMCSPKEGDWIWVVLSIPNIRGIGTMQSRAPKEIMGKIIGRLRQDYGDKVG